MVKAIVVLGEHSNRVINIVKAKYGLRDKSEAIEKIVVEYEQEIMEPELRPEFVQSVLDARRKGSFRKIKNTRDIFR